MQWTDEGFVLSRRRHGEDAAIVVLLTAGHGRHAGLARGALGRRARGLFEPGNRVRAVWSARLPEHLGMLRCELAASAAAGLMDDPLRLAGLAAACAIADRALPERQPYPRIHAGFAALLAAMGDDRLGDAWIAAYVRWELGLLAELGYGLDLERCAATGGNDQLVWVSPRSGRAVSASAGEPWRDRLLPLPDFLAGRAGGGGADLAAGLALTGHFLDRRLFAAHGQAPPAARDLFVDRFRRMATISGNGPGAGEGDGDRNRIAHSRDP